MRRFTLIIAAVVAFAACGGGSTPTPEPTAAPSASFAEQACEGTEYTRCVAGLSMMMDSLPGELVAICEYADGQGDIVVVESEADAEGMCSFDGSIPDSRVFKVVELP